MADIEGRNGFLFGIEKIAEFIGVSKPTVYKMIEYGMPARIVDGKWYAHAENIDLFMKTWTNVRTKKAKVEAEAG